MPYGRVAAFYVLGCLVHSPQYPHHDQCLINAVELMEKWINEYISVGCPAWKLPLFCKKWFIEPSEV